MAFRPLGIPSLESAAGDREKEMATVFERTVRGLAWSQNEAENASTGFLGLTEGALWFPAQPWHQANSDVEDPPARAAAGRQDSQLRYDRSSSRISSVGLGLEEEELNNCKMIGSLTER